MPNEPKRPPVRRDDADAFLPDPAEGNKLSADDAESFAEEFIASATTAEPVQQEAEDEVVDEEQGGPFLIETESADDADTERDPMNALLPPKRRAGRPLP